MTFATMNGAPGRWPIAGKYGEIRAPKSPIMSISVSSNTAPSLEVYHTSLDNAICNTIRFIQYFAQSSRNAYWRLLLVDQYVFLCSSAAICLDRSICHRWRVAICIGQPICHPVSAAICIDCTNMPPRSIWFTIHIEIHIVLSKVWGYI